MSEPIPAGQAPSPETCEPKMNALPMRLLLLLALFGTYPMALVCGVGVPLTPQRVFDVAIPTFGLLSIASIPYLFGGVYRGTGRWGERLAVLIPLALWVFALFYVVSAWFGGSVRLDQIAATMGLVLLPLLFAVVPRSFLPRRLELLMSLLWVVNVVHCLIQVAVGFSVVALAGNMNWAATLLACLLPWVWVAVLRWPPVWRWTASVVSTALTGWLVWQCHCRATWLAVVAYGVLYVLARVLSGVWRFVGVVVLVLALAVAGTLGGGRLKAAEAEDIRLPLYRASLLLSLQRPMLGVGPGNFRREYAGRRSREHLSRRVAANVTEHPHNELLRLAVELGWPVALAWAAMVGFGLWGKGMGGSPIRQACHISAFLLLAHGMLDKPLSLPPTSVLGVFFVGLLLRWRLPVRLVPPTGGRRYMLRGLGLLSVLAGGYLVSVMVWHGTLLRRGAIAEDAGMVQTAYEAYAAGAKVAPWDRTAHANAGICADRQLHRADLALPHLAAAFELEPNTAHINSNIGRALGRLKRHGEALPFFVRETELYPFDLSAWRDLFICGLLTDRLGDLPAVQDQLLALRLDAVEKRLARESGGDGADGEALARRLAAEFALSAEGGEPGQAEKALETAAALAKGLVLPGAEGGGVRGDPSQYTMLDVTFWQTRLRWRNVWLHCDRNSPGSLLEAWGTLAKDDRALGFAPFAESAGWQTLVVQSSPETVELRRGGDSYLVVPQTKKIAPGEVEQLIAEATLQRELGVSLGSATPSVLVRVGRLRLYERQQYLGYVLHTLLPETMPKLYRSPYAEMFAVRRRFEKARVKVAVRVDVLPE